MRFSGLPSAVRRQRGLSGSDCARACAAALVGCLLAVARADESVQYTLKPQPERGTLLVELVWQTGARPQSALRVAPRWGTVADVPALLKNLRFEGANKVSTEGPRWILAHTQRGRITCKYEVDAGRTSFDWNSTHHPIVTKTFFHGMGNAFLLVPDVASGPDQYETTLRWDLPRDWQAACSWGVGKHVGVRIAPTDLRHSVYLAGKLVTREVERDGHRISVALVDRFAFDADAFADLAARIVSAQCRFMREPAFPPFVVTAIPVGDAVKEGDSRLTGAGLYQSFSLCLAPQSQLTDAVEHLFAHELFHFWNGRTLPAEEPEGLVFWFTEGFTDYYALRILFESGLWDAATYAKWINRHLREYAQNPAIRATNAEIRERFWSARDTVGEVAYQRGLLLGLRWHRLARDRNIPAGLDRLMFALVERGRAGQLKLSNEDIRQLGRDQLGDWFAGEFDRYVERAEPVEVPPAALAPELLGARRAVYEYVLGFDRERSLKTQRVQGLVDGSAAARSGLRDNDDLVGWNVHADPEKQIELQVKRGGDVQTIRYYPRGTQREVLQFRPAGGRAPAEP